LNRIYLVRFGIYTYYTYRIDSATQRLEDQQSERAKTIDKLKAATKYNSTQELLEKYGGVPPVKPSPRPKKVETPSKSSQKARKASPRVGAGPPPPTANIPRSDQRPSAPSTPQPPLRQVVPPNVTPSPVPSHLRTGSAEFAPNAFAIPPQYAQDGELKPGGHWYDRVLDLLLGEDETSPRNRMALICQQCRLVNGQAPPGTKTLSDVGKWKCFGCGAMNGEEDEGTKVVNEMKAKLSSQDENLSGAASEKESAEAAEAAGTGELEDKPEVIDNEADLDDSVASSVRARRGRLRAASTDDG